MATPTPTKVNLIATLRRQAAALFAIEEPLTNRVKSHHQWQLLCSVGPLQILAGKGGVNTAFLRVGDGEREVLYPQELLDRLTALSKQPYVTYTVAKSSKDEELVLYADTKSAKKSGWVLGHHLCGITPYGKFVPLFKATKGLTGRTWTPVTSN